MYVIINVGTERAYKKPGQYAVALYKTEAAAKGVCTRLEREYSPRQWHVSSLDDYNARPVKMVERINLMSGQKYMEAEDTPNFCSPASEAFWSM